MFVSKRRTSRKEITCVAKLEQVGNSVSSDNQSIEGTVMDLSPGGISLLVQENLIPGAEYLVKFDIPLDGMERNIAVVGVLIYSVLIPGSAYKVGLKFKDLDSMSIEAISNFMW